MRYWYKPIAVILSINLVIPQVNVEKSEQKTGLVNVAYVGESMENIPESYQKLVHQKMWQCETNFDLNTKPTSI